MIVVAKVFTAIIVIVIAALATLFCVASGLTHGSTAPVERRHAALTAFWSLVVFAVCALAIVSIAGCSTDRALYDACRDSTYR
jgi:hypothetical protein